MRRTSTCPKLKAFLILMKLNISHGLFELWRVPRPQRRREQVLRPKRQQEQD
jgi:hypothetical protein